MSFPSTEPRWPSVMPQPLQAGYKIEHTDPSKSFEMDSGHTRRRATYTNAPRKASMSWKLNQTQLDALDAFFEKSLDGGAKTFAISLYGIGPGLRWAHAKFSDVYETSVTDFGVYTVSATLWILRSVAFDGQKLLVPPSSAADATANPWQGSTTAPASSPANVPYSLPTPF